MGHTIDPPILDNEETAIINTVNKLKLEISPSDQKSMFYSSPALRCLQSIKVLQSAIGFNQDCIEISEFYETNYGDITGKSGKELRQQDPDFVDLWMYKPSQIVFPNGESFLQVQNRSYTKLSTLINDNLLTKENIFICSHVDVIKLIISPLL